MRNPEAGILGDRDVIRQQPSDAGVLKAGISVLAVFFLATPLFLIEYSFAGSESLKVNLPSFLEDGWLWTIGTYPGGNERMLTELMAVDPHEKFLWYAPHNGFGNQLVAFRNALRMAGILNRTLIVPPIFEHRTFETGDCARKLGKSPAAMREKVWEIERRMLQSSSYLSMGDIMDLSSVPSDLIRTIDLRLFVATRCGVDVSLALSHCAWCGPLLRELEARRHILNPQGLDQTALLKECGVKLGALPPALGSDQGTPSRVFVVEKDCITTVFMYRRTPDGELARDMSLDQVDPQGSCPQGQPTYSNLKSVVRNLKLVQSNNLSLPEPVNIVEYLGSPESAAAQAEVVAFGSTFYFFDFHVPMGDQRADRIGCATEFLSFTPAIMEAARAFAQNAFNQSFACLHYRGGDSFFKAQRDASLELAEEDLRRLRAESGVSPDKDVPLFLMSDLRTKTWQDTFQRVFEPLGYRVRFAGEVTAMNEKVQRETMQNGYGVLTNRLPSKQASQLVSSFWDAETLDKLKQSNLYNIQNVDVFLEQAVCACADVGFIGNRLSSISKSIRHLINGHVCLRQHS